jgi:hypothetical protein
MTSPDTDTSDYDPDDEVLVSSDDDLSSADDYESE